MEGYNQLTLQHRNGRKGVSLRGVDGARPMGQARGLSGTWYFSSFFFDFIFVVFTCFTPSPHSFTSVSLKKNKDNARVIRSHNVANTTYNYSGRPASRNCLRGLASG